MLLVPECLRVLSLLLYKNCLVLKRQWVSSLICEILIPIGILSLVWLARDSIAKPPERINEPTFYPKHSKNILTNMMGYSTMLLYAPMTQFTGDLMSNVSVCLSNRIHLHPHKSESALLQDYYKKKDDINNGLTRGSIIAVIFDPTSLELSTKHMKYKIRNEELFWSFPYNIFSSYLEAGLYFTRMNYFTQIQMCIDQSFIQMKNLSFKPDSLHIQRIPDPPRNKPHVIDQIFKKFFVSTFTFFFLIILIVETAKAIKERYLGVNVLMSMNGVSDAFNLFSWILSSVIFLTLFCILPIIWIMSITGKTVAMVHYGNLVIVFLVYILYLTHSLCYGLHVSAYFPRLLFVIMGILILHMVTIIINTKMMDDRQYSLIYFGLIFPNILFNRAFEEIHFYEDIGEGIHWNNIFAVSNFEHEKVASLGGILFGFILGSILNFTMAVYIYAIKPGRYGVPKHPLYFLEFWNRERETHYYSVETIHLDDLDEKLFELEDAGNYEPGIQIRGLRKVYELGFLKDHIVHALRGVSVDFYKGQITALLGHNGAGKTTMMSILAGMQAPTRGVVLIDSKNIREKSTEIMNNMGLCTQENIFFPNLSVREQLLFFAMLKGKGKSRSTIQQNVGNLLMKFKIQEKRNSLPRDLSGGQKRRLCLGMALVGDSSILILDEPTSGLDPETKRVIWDLLLKMRGKKTILISTHDMEEADILGDRIAILHTGKLRSCGTSMFLKKSLGRNKVEVTLSVDSFSDPKAIHATLNGQGEMTSDGSKIVISIRNTPELPDLLDELENNKKKLGITGLSVSMISLEQIFLKVTQEGDDTQELNQPFLSIEEKLTGPDLTIQSIRALLSKKLTYTLNNKSTIVAMLILISIGLLLVSLTFKGSSKELSETISLSLDMYHNPITYVRSTDFKSDNKEFANQYAKLTKESGGENVKVNVKSDIVDVLLKYSKKDYTQYNNHLIAAAEFSIHKNTLQANALYSENAFFSLPISVNLVMNTFAKLFLGNEYSISVSSQQIAPLNATSFEDNTVRDGYWTAILITSFFCWSVSMFAIHSSEEYSSTIKQLQTMTGASGLTYWGTMFIFDMLIYSFLIALTLIGFAFIDRIMDLKFFMYNGMWISILIYVLFAISSLPFFYVFSFMNKSSNIVVRLVLLYLGLMTITSIMHLIRFLLERKYEFVRLSRKIQKSLFLLIPYMSFFHAQMSYHWTAQANARCVKLPNQFYDTKCDPAIQIIINMTDVCCTLGCRDGKCKSHLNFFDNFKEDVSLEESVIYLFSTSFLYFALLAALECQLFEKLKIAFKGEVIVRSSDDDEQVQQSKADIAMRIENLRRGTRNRNVELESISSSLQDNQIQFMVYELRKQYGHLVAVKDVSFAVYPRECFGLLGVNGAGKSTTFRMMTGGEVPDKGVMYIGDKDIEFHRKYFLSQMAYCPQQDALILSLNAYEHLRLFALLRGIPAEDVQDEVDIWIERLNLNACASQPSGTYSGGNKRRLNIAIALIGNPNLVLMDEPTTGVDPGARRSLWNVIQSSQMSGQAVIFTSHSMEECEALCNRLAIMVAGKLVCIGPSQELKQRFGAGYDIRIKLRPEKSINQIDNIVSDMTVALQCEVIDENLGNLVFHVTPTGMTWKKMYSVMNEMKNKYECIEDFSVLSATLERLFLLFARAAHQQSTIAFNHN